MIAFTLHSARSVLALIIFPSTGQMAVPLTRSPVEAVSPEFCGHDLRKISKSIGRYIEELKNA